MTPIQIAMLSIPVLLVLLALGAPIYLGLGVIGIAGIMIVTSPEAGLNVLTNKVFWSVAKYPYIVVPLFIFIGYAAQHAGISSNAFDMAKKWVSRLPGGLAIASTIACGVFGACCGSSVATAAAMGSVAIPEMRNAGYDKKLACGSVAAGGLIAMLIPPSIPLVIYGVLTDTSIGGLLVGGIIPGIITIVVFSVGIMILIRRNPKLAPPVMGYSWKARLGSIRDGWRVALLFIIIIGGIYAGVATPSETAALGAGAVLVMVLVRRQGALKAIKGAFSDTTRTTVMIFAIIVCCTFFGRFLTVAGVPRAFAEWAIGMDVSPIVLVILCLSIFLPLGMFLDPVSCMLLTLPIMHPVLVNQLGFDSVWLGILVTKLIEIGLLTPPVGLNVYVISGVVPDVPLHDIFRGVGWFLVFEVVTTGILIAFPILTTLLPSMMIT